MSTPALHSDLAREQTFRAFLDHHLDQEMLRFTTAGSVDDGKSTLIGRLLHDTKSVYEDQLASIRSSRVNRAGKGHVDLSLLTDGLRAEREQGITIDVAYRYFSTSRRKFIIADTPGHEQYTRNMATGASTAGVAVVLIDAAAFVKAGGLLPQSRRHTCIASLLRIPHVVAAVNKMDLVAYSPDIFREIRAQFLALADQLNLRNVELIPVSALGGDNVVEPSAAMPWYCGPTLLEYLETVPLHITDARTAPLRFPIQLVVRPDATFRGFAGRVERGELRVGQQVRALPSGRTTRVSSIVTYDGELHSARSPQSVTVTLEDEIDLSRGEMLVAAEHDPAHPAPTVATSFHAHVVWMHEQPLVAGRSYLVKHTTRTVRATVRSIRYAIDVVTAEHRQAASLEMNGIAEVEFETNLPLFFDPYNESRALGSLILIDPLSNATVGAAMVVGTADAERTSTAGAAASAFILLPGDSAAAERIQHLLHAAGRAAVVIDDDGIREDALPSVVRALQLAGVTAISARRGLRPETARAIRALHPDAWFESEAEVNCWLEEQP
ncbi:MAG TPA: sulfate adenylyltransferase subunit CysN [Acidobacteriaceae bacterium]|jgi:bifunctional enzyme CysN/CysC/sulfate adenylyltransferase subunit 1|nr:sulfate adenylyltransferase subunit CysN [Acidobacteriaceae bacterium]